MFVCVCVFGVCVVRVICAAHFVLLFLFLALVALLNSATCSTLQAAAEAMLSEQCCQNL